MRRHLERVLQYNGGPPSALPMTSYVGGVASFPRVFVHPLAQPLPLVTSSRGGLRALEMSGGTGNTKEHRERAASKHNEVGPAPEWLAFRLWLPSTLNEVTTALSQLSLCRNTIERDPQREFSIRRGRRTTSVVRSLRTGDKVSRRPRKKCGSRWE